MFVVTSLPQGVSGFIVAAIVAAALSPSINSLAATTVNDFYLKYVRPDADDATLMRVARTATIGWGIAQILVAHRRPVGDALGPRLRPVGAVAGRRSGARRVSDRRADHARSQRRHARRHGRRRRGARLGLVHRCLRLHLVRVDRRAGDGRRRACCSHCCRRRNGMPDRFEPVGEILRTAVEAHAFPAACIEVGGRDGARWNAAFGGLTFDPYAPPATPDTIFDLASLTKVIATTTLAMRAVDSGRIALQDPVSGLAAPLARQRSLTGHDPPSAHPQLRSVGLPAVLSRLHRTHRSSSTRSASFRWNTPRDSQSIYSDLGFMLLGFILEDVALGPLQPPRSPAAFDPVVHARRAVPSTSLVPHRRPAGLQSAAKLAQPMRAD